MSSIYNPLLRLDLQKKQDIPEPPEPTYDDALSDTSDNAVQNKVITEKISQMESDTRNKVSKFFTSIEELEIGEIGEYQGETNETFTNGYFYKRQQDGIGYSYHFVEDKIYYSKFTCDPIGILKDFDNTFYLPLFSQLPSVPFQYAKYGSVSANLANGNKLMFFIFPVDFHLTSEWRIPASAAIPGVIPGVFDGYLYPFAIEYNSSTIGVAVHQCRFIIEGNLLEYYSDSTWYTVEQINGVQLSFDPQSDVRLYHCFIKKNNYLIECNILVRYCALFVFTDGLSSLDDVALLWSDYNLNFHSIANWQQIEETIATYDYSIIEVPSILRIDTQPSLNPTDFATAAQGEKADTALQSIAKGTDGNYITTTIGAKTDNSQTVSATLTLQPISTAGASAKGVAEASDVKEYIGNNTATPAQGAKADSALQSIAKGTDGNYITTTIGAKTDNSQTVSATLTLQPISTAGASAKGLAESSDVKDYIGNNTATPSQGAKADSALQEIVHSTDGQFVTTTVTQKANNEQTISTALTLQGIATADAQHQGVAEASDVRNYLNIIAATSEAYGVMWDSANPSPSLYRIGNMQNHALLPVQSQMIGGVMADDGTFTPFDNQADWTQATQARDGSDGQVMVRLPKHWRRCSTFGTYNIVMVSPIEIPGYVEVREQYVSAYEASLQRSTLKLSSVNNATTDYRGGQNEESWDGTYRTLLNRPVTYLNLAEFRTYARNRGNGTKWNCMTYEAVRTTYWLFVTEYATLNSQADYTSELDANGYHQGGLGIGVSDWNGTAWDDYNGYAPLIPCGILDEYGSGTAVKNFSIYNADTSLAHTFQCNKYRGIEMPFAHIWKYVDGVLINVESGDGVSTAYTTIDPGNFSSTSVANYNAICNTYRVDSYIQGIVFNTDGDIFATKNGANSNSYYCDQYFGGNLPATTELRAWLFGGSAHGGATCGLACALSTCVPGYRLRNVGSRLCFVP